jgi:hypothetical protein
MNIDNHALRSYDSIAYELGISRKRVIELEHRALRKLRKAFAKLGIAGPQKVGQSPAPASHSDRKKQTLCWRN